MPTHQAQQPCLQAESKDRDMVSLGIQIKGQIHCLKRHSGLDPPLHSPCMGKHQYLARVKILATEFRRHFRIQ